MVRQWLLTVVIEGRHTYAAPPPAPNPLLPSYKGAVACMASQ